MNRQQVQALFLRHRDREGTLDIGALLAERRAERAVAEPPPEPHARLRHVRRMQGKPEYLIDAEIRRLGAGDG